MSKGIPRGAPGRRPGAAAPAPNLKPGGVVYFMGCKKSARDSAQPIIFKGGAHGFGVFLGVVPRGVREPGKEQMDGLMAGIGWISFDNIVEMLGEEQFKILEDKFQAKYVLEPVKEGEVMETPPAPIELPSHQAPGLVGIDGRKLSYDEETNQPEEPSDAPVQQ